MTETLRDIIARLDTEAGRAIEAMEELTLENDSPEYDLVDALETLQEAITNYQQTKGWI